MTTKHLEQAGGRHSLNKNSGWLGYGGVVLLAIHFFVVCYNAYAPGGLLDGIPDRLHATLVNIPLFADDSSAKTLAFLLAFAASWLSTPPSRQRVGYEVPLILALVGISAYFSTGDLVIHHLFLLFRCKTFIQMSRSVSSFGTMICNFSWITGN